MTTLFILLFCGLHSCSNRPNPHEKPLLFAPKTEKYWICNLVTRHDTGDDMQSVHDCMLVTYHPAEHGNYTSFFLSEWAETDSIYHQGMRMSNADVWSGKGKWPLSVYIPGDSTHADWRLYYGPRKIWLSGEFEGNSNAHLSMRGTSFMQRYDERPRDPSGLATTGAQLYQYHIPGEGAEYEAIVQLAAFSAADGIMDQGSSKAIYWINFSDFGGNGSLLLQLGQDGTLKTLGSDFSYHPHGVRFPAVCKVVPGSNWVSPVSHKSYALGLDVDFRWSHCIVRPMIQDQEIHAGKKSFWMGAIEIVDTAKGLQMGSGNMYIFTH